MQAPMENLNIYHLSQTGLTFVIIGVCRSPPVLPKASICKQVRFMDDQFDTIDQT